MGDAFQKVQSGDPLRIPAVTYNTLIDTARDYLARRQNTSAPGGRTVPLGNLVTIRNDSGQDAARFDILGIDDVVFDPDTAPQAFQNGVVFSGNVPDSESHSLGRFVILAEPVRTGEIGKAFCSGSAQVRIDVSDESHGYADIDDGQFGNLVSAAQGPAVILYKQSGTGVRWGIVRLGGAGGSTGTVIRKAVVTAAASTTLTCNLLDLKTGIEALSGPESGITVHTLLGTLNLLNAVPKALEGLQIFVASHPFWTGTSTIERWYWITNLQLLNTAQLEVVYQELQTKLDPCE